MGELISNDAALKLIAEGGADITAGSVKVAQGHAALAANLAAPTPVDPKPVDPKPPAGARIDSAAELMSALKTAKGGDVLLLAPGDYGRLTLRDLAFDGQVTIASLDRKDQAVLTGLQLIGCAGLTFRDLHLDYSEPWAVWNTQITNSRNVELRDLHAHGSVNGYPGDDQNAVLIRNSTDVKVIGCEFYEFAHAVSTMGGSDVEIRGNSFHDLRSDGVMCAGTSRVQVVGNAFTDFYPAEGDHPDAIQFLTRGTTEKARDIFVCGNLIVRGKGGIVQGVFITDQIGVGYERVTVNENVVVGGMYNGVMVTRGAEVLVSGNLVAGFADQKSWIRLHSLISGRLTGNRAMTYILEKNDVLHQQENSTIAALSDGQIADLGAWLALEAPKAVAELFAVLGKAPAR